MNLVSTAVNGIINLGTNLWCMPCWRMGHQYLVPRSNHGLLLVGTLIGVRIHCTLCYRCDFLHLRLVRGLIFPVELVVEFRALNGGHFLTCNDAQVDLLQ